LTTQTDIVHGNVVQLNYPFLVLVLQFHTGFKTFIQNCINNSYVLTERENFDRNCVYIEHLRHSVLVLLFIAYIGRGARKIYIHAKLKSLRVYDAIYMHAE
jgi:hypothetical protein